MEDQLKRVKGLLDKVTYKPGWTLVAEWERSPFQTYPRMSDWDRVQIRVSCRVPDTITPDRHVTIHSMFGLEVYSLQGMKDNQIVEYFICRAIRHMEEHEFDEWFKFDGICVRDPHPEQKGVA